VTESVETGMVGGELHPCHTDRPAQLRTTSGWWKHGRATRSILRLAIAVALLVGAAAATPAPGASPTATRGAAVRPRGIAGAWHLLFADEFRGSRLNIRKWQPGWFGAGITPPVNSSELECYARSQVSVAGGALRLTAAAVPCRFRGRRYRYRSGIVTTRYSFHFTYGVMEARIYLPGSANRIVNWPAFWGDGMGAWPATGENDVMEGLAGTAEYHFISRAGRPGRAARGRYTGWHTYAADWQPGVVRYFYDGRPVGTITTGITAAPMFLILNYGISPRMGGPTRTGQSMKVDYVRVWN
jgi:beta-glucanase (GH16 family)